MKSKTQEQNEQLSPASQPAPATQISAHIRVTKGRLLTEANAHRIVARCTRATDKMGNSLDTFHFPGRDKTPYFQKWVIKKEPKGFIFREVTHGGGICGHHPTVRALVIATLCGTWFKTEERRQIVEFI